MLPDRLKKTLSDIIHISLVSLICLVVNACQPSHPDESAAAETEQSVTVQRGNFRHAVRLSGAVGAVHSHNVQAPRLAGQFASTMVITRIVSNGTRVRAGDVLLEFDRQNQLRNIQDRQAEYDNLAQQIRKRQADHAAALAADETELKSAEVDVQIARVEMRKNEVVPGYQAEINKVNLEEAEARLRELNNTFDLKREAQAAELRILEIQHERAGNAVAHAQRNIENMTVRSPMSGLVVLRPVNRGSQMTDPQEGDEVRPGGTIMMVVDPTEMQVLARVNQVDLAKIYVGQPAEIRLEAYPDLVFTGRVESVNHIGASSTYIKRIRYFPIVISIEGSDPNLLPDLTAVVDLQLVSADDVLIVPKEAVVVRNGKAMVEVIEQGRSRMREIATGPMNECEIVIESGIAEGTIVSLRP
jgi:HlyD family secretion protein